MQNHELLCLSFSDDLNSLSFPVRPTVCLFIADHSVNNNVIAPLVQDAIEVGCTFFMTWGLQAEVLHDAIDNVIENGIDEWMNVVTTSHAGELLSDTLDFLLAGTLPSNHSFRCFVLSDKPVEELRALILPVWKNCQDCIAGYQ